MAKPGYGKRSMPGQRPRRADDFALLPARERYIAGYIDQLPDGASMDVKSLAKQLPLYGQQAVASALKALAAAGYLRRVRCLVGDLGQVRWVSRTFWSRTAHDNEWWAAAEVTPAGAATAPLAQPVAVPPVEAQPVALPPVAPPVAAAPAAHAPVTPQAPRTAEAAPAPEYADLTPGEPEPWPTTTNTADATDTAKLPAEPLRSPVPQRPAPAQAAPAPVVPQQRRPAAVVEPARDSPAYRALAELGRIDSRLALSAADCAALEARAAEWLARGVDTEYLTQALTAGLPATVSSPAGLVRRRLVDKIPPHARTAPQPPAPGGPVHRVMLECTRCGTPGRPEALPDGLCRPCREPGDGDETSPSATARPSEEDVRTLAAGIRTMLRSP
ncbi:MarR family transcriptional regulator [Streptomyces sp. bgisy091]|uniref:MarR family transcriptional regulator n=1 Tax=Streptomyces sp. bgisy091 TaxID=3413778 RepID=UPI003D70CE3A